MSKATETTTTETIKVQEVVNTNLKPSAPTSVSNRMMVFEGIEEFVYNGKTAANFKFIAVGSGEAVEVIANKEFWESKGDLIIGKVYSVKTETYAEGSRFIDKNGLVGTRVKGGIQLVSMVPASDVTMSMYTGNDTEKMSNTIDAEMAALAKYGDKYLQVLAAKAGKL